MRRIIFKFSILTGMLLGLPLLGIILAGYPIHRYLEFPPESRYISHAPFSWFVFSAYLLFIIAVTLPLIKRGVSSFRRRNTRQRAHGVFPWWGWLGFITGVATWTLAWTRFPWFVRFQPHTFTPLWISFILVINALCHRQTGRCMMINRTGFFLLLFPVSAGFWWFFEYLNRFVQNWHYAGVHYSSFEYFLYATISFSTVLPAVLGTREWIAGTRWLRDAFENFFPFQLPYPKRSYWAVLVLSGAGLTGIGIWPNHLFSLLWISPLLIIVSIQHLLGERNFLSDLVNGDWRFVISSAVAAIICGVFWEMWNFFSLARWEYSVPFVHRYQIFEMPLLGYAGYLPFGLECGVIGKILERRI
jgi:hypothetical protein